MLGEGVADGVQMSPLNIRIGLRGELGDAVREELDGFVDCAVPGGQLLLGAVPDHAALLGVLQRLHLAGLVVEDVEHLRGVGLVAGLAVARIQVGGSVADFVAGEFTDAVCTESIETTIEVGVPDQAALFAVIDRLEALGLQVREVHYRPEVLSPSV